MFAAAFAGVQEPWNAIIAAEACEEFDVKNLDSSGEENGEQTEEYDLKEAGVAAAKVRYKHALRRLKARFNQKSCVIGPRMGCATIKGFASVGVERVGGGHGCFSIRQICGVIARYIKG